MRVEVHDVEAGLAGLELAQDRVHVRAVHVGQRAGAVDGLEHLLDLLLEQAERRWVGEHHGGGARAERGLERVEVDAALRASERTVTVLKPAIEAVAGFVPCDESGTMTSTRSVSPRDSW